ncbi:hypothetical protein EAS64_32485 [Trebonia kvetii]|uniref:Uncharacterized protein n=1 Tax=Trebonia kvetii TaxID=2480626 RepID=A0A6P2BPX2_9ACTN|nr:hypothetical protein [Trebonia kvetii]TVZ01034.1 hypothetical protein EAS64_32485 [Trebonia kvetii]
MSKYRAGAVSGTSFALACCLAVAGSRWRESGAVYVAGVALGGLVAFIAATRMHGRRGGPGGAALASAAFGWAAAIAAVIFAVATYAVVVTVMSGY